MSTIHTNPYIGPRTFLKNEGHLFFGRDREARDLLSLVNSEKLVLFYAQSGAGKSSLINTRLIPNLETKSYEVLRVGRVGGEDSPGIHIENIYVFNLLRSLTQRDVSPETLAQLNLGKFLAGLARKKDEEENEYVYDAALSRSQEKGSKRRVLIIDQFEEIFSTHPEAWSKREDFFDQVAQAMESHPYLWVVLVMREDYIAALDPYAHLMPGGLRVRYYMQRLGREAAIEAVRKPVENLRPYEPGVAEKLVEDLSSIKVQKPDGTQELRPGQYVEAVQLQVVCYGLWQNLPESGTYITERDLLEVGDVDEALGTYYDGRVAEVAQRKHVKERLIRDWIEDKLIAPGGIRGMVLQDTSGKSSEGIQDNVIQALQSDLVRAENRGGTVWYELTHDRLVGPILESNKKWFEENLSPLQRQATLWHDQDRNESWLLRDQALAEVEKWADENPDELSERETEFLAACRKQQAQLELEQKEQRQSARRMRTFLAVVTVLAIIAGITAVWAFSASGEANRARGTAEQAVTQSAYSLSTAQVAEADAVEAASIANTAQAKAEASANSVLAGSLAAQADSLKNENYPLALLLAVEAYKRDQANSQTWTTLFQLLQFTPYQQKIGFEGPVSSVAVSPDGTVIAAASRDKISLFDGAFNQFGDLPSTTGLIYSLAFYQYEDRLILAAGGCVPGEEGCSADRGQLTIWSIAKDDIRLIKQEQPHRARVKTLAFSRDGKLLASGSYDQTILLWDMSDPADPQRLSEPLVGHFSFVTSLAFSPDGGTLISAGDDRNLFIWNVSNPKRVFLLRNEPKAHNAPINAIAFSPDETKLATASDDNSIILWDWNAKARTLQKGPQLKGHTGYVKSIAFHQVGDQTILASAGFDNKIILWDLSTSEQGEQWGTPLHLHTSPVNTIAFGTTESDDQNLPYLVSGSSDRTVVVWDLSKRRPLSNTWETATEPPQLKPSSGEYRVNILTQVVEVKDRNEQTFLRLSGFDSPVAYAGFQGPYLLTGYQDPFKRDWETRWSIDPDEWVRLACEAVGRSLTQKEWDQYLPKQEYRETCVSNS
jgi:WD40 repeat protein